MSGSSGENRYYHLEITIDFFVYLLVFLRGKEVKQDPLFRYMNF